MFTRLCIIDGLIRDGKYPNATSLSKEVDLDMFSIRTLKRDIEYLRDSMAAPILYDSKKRGYYYLDPSWKFPGIYIRDKDLLTLLIAKQAVSLYRGTPLAKDVDTVFERLARLMNGEASVSAELLTEHVSFGPLPTLEVHPEAWNIVIRSLLNHKQVEILYHKPSDSEPKWRVVNPYHLVNLEGAWYLLAGDAGTKNFRQFSMGRLSKAKPVDRPSSIPKSFDIKYLLDNTFGQIIGHGEKERIEVKVSKERVQWVQGRIWHPQQKIVENADGSINISFKVTKGPWPFFNAVQWVLSFGQHAKVISPPELRNLVKEEIRGMMAVYDD